jgi:flavin prenyltransferase
VKIVIGITGASGSCYAQRLLQHLAVGGHELHVVLSPQARMVMAAELGEGSHVPKQALVHELAEIGASFASGSNPPEVMVVIPCSMGTLGRIAHGVSEGLLLRAADVVLKERKKLILVPRETPLNLIHLKNMELVLCAGAILLPANPSYYSRPRTIEQLVDTVVARVMDHMGLPMPGVPRWQAEAE